jgi:MAP3K TRAFs-binding domain/Adenylate and Guanylate cyclase catalytic domain
MPTLSEYRDTAARALKQGAPLVAFDAAQQGLRAFPADPRLRQLLALALARSGASRQANQLLHALAEEGHTDEETLGMLARTYKDMGAAADEPDVRRWHLGQAFRWYHEAHQRTHGYWSGINAATLAWLLDDAGHSRRLAESVRDQCLALRDDAGDRRDSYWLLATLGEAALLLRDFPAAAAWFREAVARGTHGVADLVSTRRNARLILRHAGIDPASIDACFNIPRVAVFAGHLIDRPDRPAPRFPPEREAAVAEAIGARLRHHHIGFGYASAGNGGDILFHECLLAAGMEAHVVLPYNRAQFLEDSVDYVPGASWAERYRAVLERATRVVTASDQRMLAGSMSFEFGFLLLDGMAAIHAQELETDLICLALWDGQSGDGPGGTASSVAHWRAMKREVDIIDVTAPGGVPSTVTVITRVEPAVRSEAPAKPASPFDAHIVGLLFADAAGFSKLSEEQIPRFVDRYLQRIAETIAESDEPPLHCNTWGDGLYLVFDSVAATGRCALRLNEALRTTDWTEHGLPGTLGLRIAVHAGPAYACLDPITGRPNYLGGHVALTARIEPVTPPGEVFGSGTFAALAKTWQVRDFACDYVGQTPLAKGYGVLPMYVLRSVR